MGHKDSYITYNDILSLIQQLNSEANRRGADSRYTVAESLVSFESEIDDTVLSSINDKSIKLNSANWRYNKSAICSVNIQYTPTAFKGVDIANTAILPGETLLDQDNEAWGSQYDILLNDIKALNKVCGCNSYGSEDCDCHSNIGCSCNADATTCKSDTTYDCTCVGDHSCSDCTCNVVCNHTSSCTDCSCNTTSDLCRTDCSCHVHNSSCSCHGNCGHCSCDSDYEQYCSCDVVVIDYRIENMTESELAEFLETSGITWDQFLESCSVCMCDKEITDSQNDTCWCHSNDGCGCDSTSDSCSSNCSSHRTACSGTCTCHVHIEECDATQSCICHVHSENYPMDCPSDSTGTCSCHSDKITCSDSITCYDTCKCHEVCVEFSSEY